ncbi:MAG: sigma-54-dependent Fis family transcriptional regulator [Acidobacteria bacterium]|nr:sigma-54-dependent Fis family transcriptional regulator [Acidobacteriota bacterium]
MHKEKHAILVVDDEVANVQKLKRTFIDDYLVYDALDGDAALKVLRTHPVSAIICDQKMPGMSGVDLLRRAGELKRDFVRIILTGYTEVEDLMQIINEGQVHRYITKPWDPFTLKQTVRQELERWELRRENERLTQELKVANESLQRENFKLRQEAELLKDGPRPLVYRSRAMKELISLLDRVVSTDSTVLIQGETGTGKELLARYIHEHSPRRENTFIAVNCGAIPPDLAESAFFGHKRGAFTGAIDERKGYFELAHRGTLFLDEVGEAPLDLQVKLLRVLQEGEIFPVGAQAPAPVDVRVITSTNRNLSRMVEEGKFRQDLFFRLNVFSVYVPPLRTRPEDIEDLSLFFREQFRRKLNKNVGELDLETLGLLRKYTWPGNVRELENELERMVLLSDRDQPLTPEVLSEHIRFANPSNNHLGPLRQKLAELERKLILDALKSHHNNKSHAAETLGISRQTVIAKLRQYQKR